ncbi:MAG: family 78 glycoside hydrolase catalytic domain [Clostridia bacterium]|nr:family 78 glycoside hydrolase catalytic domain [Clostridia bacterium]
MGFSKQAKWIGSGARLLPKAINAVSPSLRLRKEVFLEKTGKVQCLICGLGIYVLHINGKRVGDDVLSPAFTNYDKRALYMEYDVSGYIQKGKNVITVELGDGFYNQTTHDEWGFFQATWRDYVRMKFELKLDGETVCVSDRSWKFSWDGPTIHNAIRLGEYYDARKKDGWLEADYDDSAWQQACVVLPVAGKLCKQEMPPIRECESYPIVNKWKTKAGWMVDFGKNISGYISLHAKGEAGKTLRFIYNERVKDGEPDRWDIARYIFDTEFFSEDRYTFAGTGEAEDWKPQFVYHGFRYVEIIGLDEAPADDMLTAHFVHTDLRRKGNFKTTHELLDWLYDAGIRSFLSNWHGFSEDCPHREKNGWTGDAVISVDYAVCHFDMVESYKKWMQDICETQRVDGMLAGVAPTSTFGYNWGNGPAWDCSIFIIPYVLYLETGNTDCFDIVYETAGKYLEYAEYFRENGLVCYGLADWCPPRYPDGRQIKIMSNRLSDSCYYYAMQSIYAKMCEYKGDTERAEIYRNMAQETRQGILDTYVNGDHVDNDSQGALAEVLYFRIVEGEQAKRIAKRLHETVRDAGFLLEAGILGLKALLNALSAYGYTETAFRIVAHYEYPSYGYWKNCGATTLWENWNGVGSQNHHMYADVLNWEYRNVLGLKNTSIGYKTCVLQPFFYEENCVCEGETETPDGKIKIRWEKQGARFMLDLEVPDALEMTLLLPDRAAMPITSGKYEYNL